MRAAAVAPEQQQAVHERGDDHNALTRFLLFPRDIRAIHARLRQLQLAAVALSPVGVEVEDGSEDAAVFVRVIAVPLVGSFSGCRVKSPLKAACSRT